MRKVPVIFLGVVLAFTGCSGGGSPNRPAAAEKPVVALVVKTLTNPFFIAMEKGARKAEAELGFVLKVKSGAQETSIDQQIAIIEDLIAGKTAAIVIAPGSSTELIPVLKKAQDRGIQLVNIDNQLDPTASEKAGLRPVPFISVDNVKGAYLVAQYLVQGISQPTQALVLEGIREAANANQRKTGALQAFGENPRIQVVASETAHWKIDEGLEVTRLAFKAHPGIGVIFAANDMMALGAVEYLKEAGLTRVRVAGYDALDEARKAIAEGRMVATVDQQADQQGYIGCVTAIHLLQGAQVPSVVTVDVKLVTKDTVSPAP
jgi:ribose transport system substrate-binding protein